jgi:SNF2 family DNA or RNA helicase
MRAYQRDKAVPFVLTHPLAALFMDMGLGKTIVVLTAILEMFRLGIFAATDAVLVIAPLRVAKGVWAQEAQDWSHTTSLRIARVVGDVKQRLAALHRPAQIYVINVESTQWFFRVAVPALVKALGRFPFRMLVIDESSKFKHPDTERFKALEPMLPMFDRRLIMSGTPVPQGLMNLFGQMVIVDRGQRLGTSKDRFKFRFFAPVARLDFAENAYKWEARAGAMEYVSNLIRDVALRMDAEDYLQLPPVLENDVWVDLPPEPRRLYDQFERDMFLQLDAIQVEAFNAATLTQKCHQLANGAVYNDPEIRREYTVFHDEKTRALEDTLDSEESNVLLAYSFRHDLARITQLAKTKFKDRRFEVFTSKNSVKLQDEWNAGKVDILALNAQSAAHGVNIQYGGSAITQFSRTWSNEDFRQLIKRLQRPGQAASTVRLHNIMARDTIDEAIRLSNNRNERGQRGFLDSLNLHRATRELLS